jgi:hypothetical protein
VLVLVENRQAVHVLDRHDGLLEVPRLPGLGRALLAFDGILIDVVARETVFRGDEIGGDALRHEIGFDRDRGIGRPGTARGADADADMDSTPPPMAMSFCARHDLGGGEIHRLEARGAEAVDLDARHFLAVIGGNRGGAGNIAARLAHGIDAAHHHVVESTNWLFWNSMTGWPKTLRLFT